MLQFNCKLESENHKQDDFAVFLLCRVVEQKYFFTMIDRPPGSVINFFLILNQNEMAMLLRFFLR